MNKPQPSPKEVVEITPQGSKSNPLAVAYLKRMLENFELFGQYTYTATFTHADGRARSYGIRMKHHSPSGVELWIQAEKGSSRYVEGHLARRGQQHDQLFSALLQKFAGKRYYTHEEWNDSRNIIPMPPVETVVARAPEPPTPSESADTGEDEDLDGPIESIGGYLKNDDDRNLVLSGVYEVFGRGYFTADKFVETVQTKLRINAKAIVLKPLLRRLTKRGFFESRSELGSERFRLTRTVVDYLVEMGLITVSAKEEPEEQTTTGQSVKEVALKVLAITERVNRLVNAQAALKRNEAELALIEAERKKTEAKLAELKAHAEKLQSENASLGKILVDASLLTAQGELEKLLEGD